MGARFSRSLTAFFNKKSFVREDYFLCCGGLPVRLIIFIHNASADPFKLIRVSYHKPGRLGLRSKHLLQGAPFVMPQQGEGEDERCGRACRKPAVNILTQAILLAASRKGIHDFPDRCLASEMGRYPSIAFGIAT